MSFSDIPFPYGPFAPHHVPKQYIESYFSHHKTDSLLSLNTTVEDISLVKPESGSISQSASEKWKLILRQHDPVRKVDIWWEETFDCVVLANGHYTVPYVRTHLPPCCLLANLTISDKHRYQKLMVSHNTSQRSRSVSRTPNLTDILIFTPAKESL